MSDLNLRLNILPQQKDSPDWVLEMHRHFQQNGFYAAEDLQKVLGDPRTRVEVPSSQESPVNFLHRKE